MNPALRLGYEAVAQLARVTSAIAAGLAPRTEAKALRALSARRGIDERFRIWGAHDRDRARPLLWMHAPSVGEGLQARPVLQLMRARHPDVQLAYTHFSPSAEAFARSLDVDFRDYIPFDTAGAARSALDALRPKAIIFAKLDLWPTLSTLAHARGVRLGLVSATLAESSSRRSTLAVAVLRDAYRLLDAVGAVDAEDAERLVALGVRPNVIRVTGDTRYDQVWERARRTDRASALLAPLRAARPTLVAGSSWPADEAVLLTAFASLRRSLPAARLVIAPHEPTAAHLAPIEAWAKTERLSLARLAAAGPETDVVLVDRVGVLGELYALADVAFVGGGFHKAGLHSVLEPAAFGAPVLFGPRFSASRDAMLLARCEAGRATSDSDALARAALEWLGNRTARDTAGARAASLVREGLGAAERSLELVEELMS